MYIYIRTCDDSVPFQKKNTSFDVDFAETLKVYHIHTRVEHCIHTQKPPESSGAIVCVQACMKRSGFFSRNLISKNF